MNVVGYFTELQNGGGHYLGQATGQDLSLTKSLSLVGNLNAFWFNYAPSFL